MFFSVFKPELVMLKQLWKDRVAAGTAERWQGS